MKNTNNFFKKKYMVKWFIKKKPDKKIENTFSITFLEIEKYLYFSYLKIKK